MKNRFVSRTRRRLGQLAFAVAGTALLVGGLPQAQAGAAGSYPTTTTVASSVATPVTGQSITFTATVRASSAPSGSRKAYDAVTFTVIAPDTTQINCDGGNTPVLSGGTAPCTISAGLASDPTAYVVNVVYSGSIDSVYGPSSTAYLQTVAPGSTTTTVTTSKSLTVTGEPVTFTAAVVPNLPAMGTLTGSVKFSGVSRYGTCLGGSNTVPVVAGLAQCSLAGGLPKVGSPFTVTATYLGDPHFAGSSGHVVQNVRLATATVAMALSPGVCNGSFCTTGEGTPLTITITATPSAPSTTNPAGPVVMSIIPAGTTTSLQCQGGNSIMLSGGQGACTLPNGIPAVVYYTVTATLADPNFKTASSQLFLNSALGSTNTTLTSVPVNAGAGTSFSVVATVTQVQPSVIVPTGRVSMSVCSKITFACQGFPVSLHSDGTATMTVRGGEFPGAYTAYAHYLGDQNYYASTAPSASMTVIKSTTTTKMTSTANPSADGSGVTFTATVKGQADSSSSNLVGPPSGYVTFSVTGPSGSLSCAGGNMFKLKKNVVTQGVVTCFVPAGNLTDPAAPGTTSYTVSASYTGDSNYDASSSTYTQTVVPAVP